MIFAIAARELRSLFLSPLAWAVLGVLQAILAWIFLVSLEQFLLIQPRLIGLDGAPGVTDIVVTPLFSLIGILLLLVMPLMTMRLISEERRNKTLTLLLSAPVTTPHIVLGKFLAILCFILLMLVLLLMMSLSLAGGTHLDYGQIAGTALGLLLMISAFAAIGLYISCLTDHPTVAAVVTFGVLFMLWIVSWAAQTKENSADLLRWLSMMQHQESFQRGVLNSSDALYYIIVIVVFLLLSMRRLDAERLQA
ncbi:MAG: ABC transporter permease subunit [Gammaproteobacteria bacterium]|nr:ABC transporter permease subunit [Gammaproteobacteria bacterium]